MAAKLISILATVVLIAATIALFLQRSLFAIGPITAGVQIAAILLVLWARFALGFRSFHFAANPTPGGLVTSGPYRYIRNPIYAAAWLFTWTGAAAHWSAVNVILALIIGATLVVRIVCEEKLLRAAYPEYDEYARRTKRLIPWVV